LYWRFKGEEGISKFYTMKKILLLLLCFSGGMLVAQNYQNICTPGITFYINSAGKIMAFRQDSIWSPGNNDTIFISYRTIRPFFINGCYDTTNGSILGRRIYKKQDGTFYFFNWNHDTLTIKSQTAINETWKFCNLTGGSRIDATVINILTDTVLGLSDQVKIISFQAKDQNGNNIPHFLNLKTISLSRHYGITKTFDLYFMPDTLTNDTASYMMNGKTALHLGIQNLTWRDIYNFDVGDEFHYTGNQTYWGYGSSGWNIIKRVLGKEVFGNMDSVKYTMEFCKIMWLPQPPPNIETTYDTVVESYDFITLGNDETVQKLPESFSSNGYGAPSFGRGIWFPGRQTQEYIDFSYYLLGNCWGFPFEPYYYTFDYSEGLGNTYKFHMEIDFDMITWQEALVYYKKGSEIWGTPVALNCVTLIPVEEKTKPVFPDMRINPNPVETEAEISLEGFKQSGLRYILYNNLGQQVYVREIHSDPLIFDRSGLPGGLYVITLVDDNNTILAREKIILK
jgi:hypothetical protein